MVVSHKYLENTTHDAMTLPFIILRLQTSFTKQQPLRGMTAANKNHLGCEIPLTQSLTSYTIMSIYNPKLTFTQKNQ